MKLSELIKSLQGSLERLGDLEVAEPVEVKVIHAERDAARSTRVVETLPKKSTER